MNPADAIQIPTAYLVGGIVILVGFAGSLIATVWSMIRAETARTEASLSQKASIKSVEDAQKLAVDGLRELKHDLQAEAVRQHDAQQMQVAALTQKQEREMDRLTAEMGKLSDNLQAMRSESSAQNLKLMESLQTVLLKVSQHGGRRES